MLDGGRAAEAVAVRREIYERRAIHQDYLKLRHAAQQAGQWADLSGWALNLLRDRAHAEQWYVRELVSVLVSENLLDEAWAAAMANPGQVPESQWFQLTEVREKDHPAEDVPTASRGRTGRFRRGTARTRCSRAYAPMARASFGSLSGG